MTDSSITAVTPPVRPRCPACQRALRTCICALAQPVEHPVEVLILQHPMEVTQAKGTGRLLHLCLPNSRLVEGERWDEAALHDVLYAPWHSGATLHSAVLLYPEGVACQPPPALNGQPNAHGTTLRLVVLDATWRKSRKMLHANPLLQTLPRFALNALPPPAYRIRKAQAPGQLSTLEATGCALAQWNAEQRRGEGGEVDALSGLWQTFEAMQSRYMAWTEEEPVRGKQQSADR